LIFERPAPHACHCDDSVDPRGFKHQFLKLNIHAGCTPKSPSIPHQH
jgi:hypothetical protein